MEFNQLSDEQLIASTERALQTSRAAEIEVLRHIREIEKRRLWVHAGSLYKYLSRRFQLTDDQIYPRLQAMRLMNTIPEVEQQLIEELKAKYSHQMPKGKMEELMKILIQMANRQPQPKNRVTIKARSRYIPTSVKREMEKTRHEGCCHVDPALGDRCGSRHFLQLDHIHEYSRGGLNAVHNLRWLCGFHNRNRSETGSQ